MRIRSLECFYVDFTGRTLGAETFSLLHPSFSFLSLAFSRFLFNLETFYFDIYKNLHFFSQVFFHARTRSAYTHFPYHTAKCLQQTMMFEGNNKSRQAQKRSCRRGNENYYSILSLVLFHRFRQKSRRMKQPASVYLKSTREGGSNLSNSVSRFSFLFFLLLHAPILQHYSCRMGGCWYVQVENPHIIPGSYFMSNKYLCLYFV